MRVFWLIAATALLFATCAQAAAQTCSDPVTCWDQPRCPEPQQRQATIGGKRIHGYVLPTHGKPLKFAKVAVYSSSGQAKYVGETDKDGGFTTGLLPEDNYRLVVIGWGSTLVRLSSELDEKYGGFGGFYWVSLMDNECVGIGYAGN